MPLASGPFAPGRGDPRTLGVRRHEVRLSPADGAFQPGLPPLLPLSWALGAVLLVFWTGVIVGIDAHRAREAGVIAAALVTIGIVFARAWTVWLLPAATYAEAALPLLAAALPRQVGAVASVVRDAGSRLLSPLRTLDPLPLAALVILGAARTVVAYRLQT